MLLSLPSSPLPLSLSLSLSPLGDTEGDREERERELSFACVMKVNLPSDRWTNLAPKRKKCLNRVGGGPCGSGRRGHHWPHPHLPPAQISGGVVPRGRDQAKTRIEFSTIKRHNKRHPFALLMGGERGDLQRGSSKMRGEEGER